MIKYPQVMVSVPDIPGTFSYGLSGLRKKMHVLGDKFQSLNQTLLSKTEQHRKADPATEFLSRIPNSSQRDTITAAYTFKEAVINNSCTKTIRSHSTKSPSLKRERKNRRIKSQSENNLFTPIENDPELLLPSPRGSKRKREADGNKPLPDTSENPSSGKHDGVPYRRVQRKTIIFLSDKDTLPSDASYFSLYSDQEGFFLVLDDHITI